MNPALARQLMARALREHGSDVVVSWVEVTGGTKDPVTNAMIGGVQTPVRGVMRTLGAADPARSVVRQFAAVEASDLVLDVDPDGLVRVLPELTRTVTLEEVARKGVRFQWSGCWYVQKEVGEELAATWDVLIGNQRVGRTLLLRRAT